VQHQVLSADTHVFEPARLWLDRVAEEFRDRAPHVERVEGIDTWFCDGHRLMSTSAALTPGIRGDQASPVGKPFEALQGMGNVAATDLPLRGKGHMDQVRPGSYIPDEAVKDMELDGVDAGVIYPSVGLVLYTLPDGVLVNELFRAYNDWMGEFCQPFPGRLLGIGLVNVDLDDVKTAVSELERCAGMGLKGALISVYPGEERNYSRPEYEAFWAAAADLRMVLGLHISTNRVMHDGKMFAVKELDPATQSNADHWIRQTLAHMILSGVFERHPDLCVGAVEYEMAWVPHFLDRMDYVYTSRPFTRYFFKNEMLPSDFFRRNSFVTFTEDPIGVEFRNRIGVDTIMWGSDYPHPESTFPRSQEVLEGMLKDCTEEERVKLTYANCARVFGLG
jgi:predicted TIM-barrel fold metal-dependent hydrolase